MARRKDWAQIAAEYQQRTCTADEFCKRHGINAGTLQYHLRQHRPAKADRFLPVEVQQEPREEVTLEFSSGLRLTIRG